jgi:hypothetical protein
VKNLKIVVAFCLLLLAGVVLLLWPSASKSEQPPHPLRSDREVKRQITTFQEGVKKPEGMSDANWQRALRVHSIRKSANRNIDFYGKIIDQNGEPVEGVNLEFEMLGYQDSFLDYLNTGQERIKNKFTMTTDANGMFAVEQKKGTSLSIERMRKEGYVFPDRGVQNNFVYSNLSSGEESSMYHSADKSQPVVYRGWKQGETEPLIKTGVKLTIDPEAGIHEVYYLFSLAGKQSPTPMPGWDIKVTGRNDRTLDNRNPQNDYWEVTFTVSEGGGILLTDSPHANLAPETGYQKSLTLKSTDQKSPGDRPVRRAYFRSANGKTFAAFRLDLGFGTIKTGAWIEVWLADLRINPNGSRNLEYDPKKRIK